jgi:hypothetical protein
VECAGGGGVSYGRRNVRPVEVTKLLDDAGKDWPNVSVIVLVREQKAIARYIEDLEEQLDDAWHRGIERGLAR